MKNLIDILNESIFDIDDEQITNKKSVQPKNLEQLKKIIRHYVISKTTNEHIDIDTYVFDLNWIDTSKVQEMQYLFLDFGKLHFDVSKWNVSRVNDMHGMFSRCSNFNGDLSNWDVSNVEDMEDMFYDCTNFEGIGLDKWKPNKLLNIHKMFFGCSKIKYPFDKWDMKQLLINMSLK